MAKNLFPVIQIFQIFRKWAYSIPPSDDESGRYIFTIGLHSWTPNIIIKAVCYSVDLPHQQFSWKLAEIYMKIQKYSSR